VLLLNCHNNHLTLCLSITQNVPKALNGRPLSALTVRELDAATRVTFMDFASALLGGRGCVGAGLFPS
jgi:hypothetical protein